MSSFDRARDAVDFVTATIDSLAGVVENAIFSVNLVDGGAPASGIVFTEDITKIADQQGDMLYGMACLLSASSRLAISRPGTALLARRGLLIAAR